MRKIPISLLLLFVSCVYAAPTAEQCKKQIQELNPKGIENCIDALSSDPNLASYKAQALAIKHLSDIFDKFQPEGENALSPMPSSTRLRTQLLALFEKEPFDTLKHPGKEFAVAAEVEKLINWLAFYKPQYYKRNAKGEKAKAIDTALLEFDVLAERLQPCSEYPIMYAITNSLLDTYTPGHGGYICDENRRNAIGLRNPAESAKFKEQYILCMNNEMLPQAKTVWKEKTRLKERNSRVQYALEDNLQECNRRNNFDVLKSTGNKDKTWEMLSPELRERLEIASRGGAGTNKALTDYKVEDLLPGDVSRLEADLAVRLPWVTANSVAAKEINDYYKTHGKNAFKIEISDVGAYAAYNPSNGTIVISRNLINDYIKVTGKSYSQIMADKDEKIMLANFISPMFVHEATHQIQHSRAKTFSPYTTTSEVEASATQALFMLEKQSDAQFISLFEKNQTALPYAQQMLQSAQDINGGAAEFAQQIEVLYPEVLTQDAATAHFLALVTNQLNNPDYRDDIFINGETARKMAAGDYSSLSNKEFADYITAVDETELRRIQTQLMALENAFKTNHSATMQNIARTRLLIVK